MGTSRHRTPPAPVSAGPRGRPDRYRGKPKTSKSPFGFKWNYFCPKPNPWLPSPGSTSSKMRIAGGVVEMFERPYRRRAAAFVKAGQYRR
jgi:hypothetical protein